MIIKYKIERRSLYGTVSGYSDAAGQFDSMADFERFKKTQASLCLFVFDAVVIEKEGT